eukprot:6180422-Pleurochrysis_carterae.AAC.1
MRGVQKTSVWAQTCSYVDKVEQTREQACLQRTHALQARTAGHRRTHAGARMHARAHACTHSPNPSEKRELATALASKQHEHMNRPLLPKGESQLICA